MNTLDAQRRRDDVKIDFHVCSMLMAARIVWGREGVQ